ncbi:MAG: O-methyltransferase [Tumebacillaceae bacterium]
MTTREQYVADLFVQEDEMLSQVRASVVANGMPSIWVSPELGKMLYLLVKMSNSKRILEIGALGGYSGVWLTRGLPEDGKLISLELMPEYAKLAHENLTKAGRGHQVEYRVGEALDSLKQLLEEGQKFDFFFIDADKINYPNYLELAIQLSNPGAIITGDNVMLGNRVIDPENNDENTLAMREFNKRVATDERLESILLPVRDGLSIARVK